MEDGIQPGPVTIPQLYKDTVDLILNTNGEMLRGLICAPDRGALRQKIREYMPDAKKALELEHITGDLATETFTDAAERAWLKAHPENSTE